MAEVLIDNAEYSEKAQDKGVLERINDFRKEQPIIFWSICLGLGILLVFIIILIVRKLRDGNGSSSTGDAESPPKESFIHEAFAGTNELNNEYDYLNSVLDATLGDDKGYNNIVGKAVKL